MKNCKLPPCMEYYTVNEFIYPFIRFQCFLLIPFTFSVLCLYVHQCHEINVAMVRYLFSFDLLGKICFIDFWRLHRQSTVYTIFTHKRCSLSINFRVESGDKTRRSSCSSVAAVAVGERYRMPAVVRMQFDQWWFHSGAGGGWEHRPPNRG